MYEFKPLAPLHNPPGVFGMEAARRRLPDLPHVAVFDRAFFYDLPAAAATYAIDRDVAEPWHVRRHGFHGVSHVILGCRVRNIFAVQRATTGGAACLLPPS